MNLNELHKSMMDIQPDTPFKHLLYIFKYQVYYFAGGKKRNALIESNRKQYPEYSRQYNTMYKLLQFVYNYDEFCAEYKGTGYGAVGSLFKRLNTSDFSVIMRSYDNTRLGYVVTTSSVIPSLDSAREVLTDVTYLNFFFNRLIDLFTAVNKQPLSQQQYMLVYETYKTYLSQISSDGKLKAAPVNLVDLIIDYEDSLL